jgi:hypothetical protein
MKSKQFPITATKEDLELLAEGARISHRSISNYLIWSGLQQLKILKNSEVSSQ